LHESPLMQRCQANEFQQPSALYWHSALQVGELWVTQNIVQSPTAPRLTMDAAVLRLPLT